MKWLIVGGEGQFGKATEATLRKHGIDSVSLDRSQLDITNEDEIEHVLRNIRPNIVLNAAAWTKVDDAEGAEVEAWQVNARGAGLLARTCSTTNSKLIHISTDYVFSGLSNTPWAESDVQNPLSAYGRTKAEGELLVQEFSKNSAYIVRTAWLYSPWGKNFAKTIAGLALHESREVTVVGDQIGQPTSAIDLAEQILQMVDRNVPPGIYHGTNSGEATWFDFAKEIFLMAGADSDRLVPIESSEYLRAAKPPSYSVLGHNKWIEVDMKPMKGWHEALAQAMPSIVSSLSKKE